MATRSTSGTSPRRGLPPGQRAVAGFPRFGTHLGRRPPAVPERPVLAVRLPDGAELELTLGEVVGADRREQVADLHCVSGWSATGLRWQGVPFARFYEDQVAPRVTDDPAVTHLLLGGLDGFETAVLLEDALANDVMVVDRLDGRPLTPDHGAPLRFVSPSQYGYLSCKHLCRIELLVGPPRRELGAGHPWAKLGLRGPLIMRHPRARVWDEERHPRLPAALLRPLYRLIYQQAFRLFPGNDQDR